VLSFTYFECHYSVHYSKCHYAERHYTESHGAALVIQFVLKSLSRADLIKNFTLAIGSMLL
jgi:hypothetical protein